MAKPIVSFVVILTSLNDPTLASYQHRRMTTKRCTVAQLLLRLNAVTWLTAEGVS